MHESFYLGEVSICSYEGEKWKHVSDELHNMCLFISSGSIWILGTGFPWTQITQLPETFRISYTFRPLCACYFFFFPMLCLYCSLSFHWYNLHLLIKFFLSGTLVMCDCYSKEHDYWQLVMWGTLVIWLFISRPSRTQPEPNPHWAGFKPGFLGHVLGSDPIF